jgi:RHS repeat-associated protein
VVQLTDDTGFVTKNYRYDAFGVEQNPQESDTNWFRYCGEYFDVETGTVYLRARYYDPVIGRFTTEDPIRDGLNWYTYCSGNPIFFVDPTGEANSQTLMNDTGHSGQLAAQIAKQVVDNYLKKHGTLDIFTMHDLLDVLGFIPVIGDILDLGNGIYYLAEGDYTNAAFSGLALIPIAGDLVSKSGKTVVKAAGKADDVAGLIKGAGKTDNIAALGKSAEKGFASFDALKRVLGSAGEGKQWHHIVEQNQILKSGFDPQKIHSTANVIALDAATHAKISGYYNSIRPSISGNMRIRDWLAGQSYEFQYQFGMQVLRDFGGIK